ncbi:MAG: TetR/AcrR family transcriptional regulator [Burkholderiales bacterium]
MPAARPRTPATRAKPAAARPQRDAVRTQAAILDAATHEFARHGLGGARVDRIAERAGTNKRMLYYYFGAKAGLFLAVLERAYEHIRGEEQRLHLTDLPPAAAVAALVAFTWNYFLAHPEFMRLLNDENLHHAQHLKRSRRIRAMHSPLVATLSEVLDRGARAGEFRRGVDPVQLYVSIAALGYFYLSNHHTLSTIFGRDLMSAPAKADRLAHMQALVLHSLSASSRVPRLARGRRVTVS